MEHNYASPRDPAQQLESLDDYNCDDQRSAVHKAHSQEDDRYHSGFSDSQFSNDPLEPVEDKDQEPSIRQQSTRRKFEFGLVKKQTTLDGTNRMKRKPTSGFSKGFDVFYGKDDSDAESPEPVRIPESEHEAKPQQLVTLRSEGEEEQFEIINENKSEIQPSPDKKALMNSDRALLGAKEKRRLFAVSEENSYSTTRSALTAVPKGGSFVVEHKSENTMGLDMESLKHLVSEQNRRQSIQIKPSAQMEKPRQSYRIQYPQGFTADDDLNKDGKIDRLEAQIKVMALKDDIRQGMDHAIAKEYNAKLKKEVDFHHKVAYRFEKSYKLRKNATRKGQADEEIIDLITENPDYLIQDQMALFYLVYFCIYFRNKEMTQFVRVLVSKIEFTDKKAVDLVEYLLERLDTYGMDTLRKVGEKVNEEIYHLVMYQAFDDKLTIVYSQVIQTLKFIQLRDRDGHQLLTTRNYVLIKACLDKYCSRTVFRFDHIRIPAISIVKSYRQYNSAYFEEIILRYHVEERMAKNFRERFLIEPTQIYQVLTMYTKNDFLEHFLRVDVKTLTNAQLAELLLLSIREDSYMIALQLYLKHVPPHLLDEKFLSSVIESLAVSIGYYEYKLFFIHEHFDELSIIQLNDMIDNLLIVLFKQDLRLNPLMNQANPIKITLLIYRICWKIEKKRIYSLITKCEVINQFIFKSLEKLLEEQRNISYLHKLMLEPVLTLREKEGDILDMMLGMNMQNILNHPVIIEVLNLVNEGQQSVDSPILYLITSLETFFEMKTFDNKPVSERILKNITGFGSGSDRKQTGLHFHIWKNCLQQRTQDEVLFSLILCGALLYYFYWVNDIQDQVVANMTKGFTDFIGKSTFVWWQADPAFLANRCQFFATGSCVLIDLAIMVDRTAWISHIIWVAAFSTLFQHLIVLRVAKNSVLSMGDFWSNVAVLASTTYYLFEWHQTPRNDLITDYCHANKLSYFTPFYTMKMGQGLFFASDFGSSTGLQFRLTLVGASFMIKSIKILEKTEVMGYLIMMIQKTLEEILKFLITFGLLFLTYILAFRMMKDDLLLQNTQIPQLSIFAFDSLSGHVNSLYTTRKGTLIMVIFTSIAFFCLMGFLATMFVVRYLRFSKLIEAEKRSEIINIKNKSSNIPVFGAITTSYFPLNIFLLPFYLPMILIQSDRVNDFAMKFQFFFLVFGYIVLGFLASIPGFILLYLKLLLNAGYMVYSNKRQKYPGENGIRFVFVLFLGPILTIVSLGVDFLSLNIALFRDERHLELKYQPLNYYKDIDRVQISNILFRTFIFKRRPTNADSITELELMQNHVQIFKIIDNFHSFFCRGDKSYKEASQNIKVFNLSKIMGSICSVPCKIGIKRHNTIEFDVITNMLKDLAMFNFYHRQLCTHKIGGNLTNFELVDIGQAFDNFNHAKYSRHQSLPRDITDAFNTLCVNVMARSFSDIEEEIAAFREETNFYRSKQVATSMNKWMSEWKSNMVNNFEEAMGGLQDHLEKFDEDHGALMWKMKTRRTRQNTMNDISKLLAREILTGNDISSFMSKSVIREEVDEEEEEEIPTRQVSQHMGPIEVTVDQAF